MHSYTLKRKIRKEIKERIPFTIAPNRIKNLEINLPKEAKVLYSENYKMLMKEIKGDTNRWSKGFPGAAVVENLPAIAGDMGSSPGLGRSHMPWSN